MRRGRTKYRPQVVCSHPEWRIRHDPQAYTTTTHCVECRAVGTVTYGEQPVRPPLVYKTNFPNFKKV
jgi:hypothetical protein